MYFSIFSSFPCCMHPLNSSFRQGGPGREKGLQDFCSWRPFDAGHCEFGFGLSFVNLRHSNGHRKIAHYEAGPSEWWVLLLKDTSDFSRAAASKKVIFKRVFACEMPCMLTWLAWQCPGCGPSHLLRIPTSKFSPSTATSGDVAFGLLKDSRIPGQDKWLKPLSFHKYNLHHCKRCWKTQNSWQIREIGKKPLPGTAGIYTYTYTKKHLILQYHYHW